MPSSTARIYVRNPDTVSKWLKWLNGTHGLTFRAIALKPYFSGMPPGTLCSIAKTGKVPKKWMRKLNLRCPDCGRFSHEYNCKKQRVTAKNGTGKRSRSKRAPTIELALSDLDHAAKRLSERTGKKWSYK